jgi:hypothetical protein
MRAEEAMNLEHAARMLAHLEKQAALHASRQSQHSTQGNTMPRTSEMLDSKYLKQADVPDPVIVTVTKVGRVNIAKEGEKEQLKWAIRFQEFDKPMLLNSTNIKLLEKAFDSDDTDDWAGKEIILYTDENVSFGGEIVGGLRFRRNQPAPIKKAAGTGGAKTLAEMDDDIPF